jgi:hypothetical protein
MCRRVYRRTIRSSIGRWKRPAVVVAGGVRQRNTGTRAGENHRTRREAGLVF